MNPHEAASQIPSRNVLSCLLATGIILACALLAREPELRLAVPLLVGTTAVMVMVLALALYTGERGAISWSPAAILGVALLLRLLFLFAPPQLSDDIYRYLWDGSTLLRGINPYATAPAAVTPPPDLIPIQRQINHPDYVTIYPPTAQLLFAGGAATGGITGLKGVLILLDLGLCVLLMILLKQLKLPVWRTVLYAWNPLPVVEIAGSGHVDGAGLTLLMGAICLLFMEYQRTEAEGARSWPYLLSGVLLSTASLVKLFPLVLAPFLYLLVPRARKLPFLAGFAATMALLLLPFLPHLTKSLTTLKSYARNWEFAGYAFTTLRTLTGSGSVARLLLAALFVVIVGFIILRLIQQLQKPQSAALLGRRTLQCCYAVALWLLLLTPTLQPWYALCLAVFLPFCAGPTGLVLCWSVFLTYQVQIPYFILGQWLEEPLVTSALFLAPVMAFTLSTIFRDRKEASH
jgi:hypothetical protein